MSQMWYFLLRKPVNKEAQATLQSAVREALRDWHTHGQPIAFEISFPYNHYVAITARTPVSGCATDHLFRTLLPLLQPLPSHYLLIIQNGNMKTEIFYEIIKLKNVGQWQEDWRVVEVVAGELRERRLEESSLAVHL